MNFELPPGLLHALARPARRAHDHALAYASRRQAFGKPLAEHEGVGFMLADNDMDLQTARLHIWHTAWLLDQGQSCNFESSRIRHCAPDASAKSIIDETP